MKVWFVLCLFMLAGIRLMAQESPVFSVGFQFEAGSSAYLFGNDVKFREAPDLNAPVITLLEMGRKVKIVAAQEQTMVFDGIESPWYEVEVDGVKGYVLGALISLCRFKSYANSSAEFFCQLKKVNDDPDDFRKSLKVRTRKPNEPVRELVLDLRSEEFELKLVADRGIDNLENIFIIDYFAEACGVEGGIDYYFWTGKELVQVGQLSTISDAGVFYREQKFIFPFEEGGQQGVIQFVSELHQTIDESQNWDKTTIVKRDFVWNGLELVPPFKWPFDAPRE